MRERKYEKGKVERSGKRREGSRGQEKEEKENITSYLLLSDSYYSRCHIRIYGGMSLLQSPLGPNKLSWLVRCLYFRGRVICIYKVGTRSNVLNNQGVLISEISFKRGSTVVTYVCIRYLIHKHTLRHIFGMRWKCVHSYRTRLQQHSAARSTQTDPFLSLCEEKISSILHYKHFEQRSVSNR